MSNYTLTEDIKQKWQPVLEHKSMPEIKDSYKRLVTTIVLENQFRFTNGNGFAPQALTESSAAVNVTGGTQVGGTSTMANWDPVLVSLVRRSTPNLLAFDVAGVQPMTGPTGLLFALRSRYSLPNGKEALFNEADSDFSGAGVHAGDTSGFTGTQLDTIFGTMGNVDSTYGTGMATATGEALGNGNPASQSPAWGEVGFSIEKTSVVAKTRALKAQYTTELAQDLRNVHGLDAEAELANILTTEILAEQNRELIRTINVAAKLGGGSTTTGALDLTIGADTDGRWFVERFKSLVFQMEIEANKIAKDTRRGRGNFIICSSDVASAISMAGILDYAPAMSTNLTVDDTGNLFAGVINGRIKVYIDPYASINYVTVGYRGANQFDAGIFYAPYVPLEMVRAVGEDNFQPRLGFKTRYGIVANPFATITSPVEDNAIGSQSGLAAGTNMYYRKFAVTNLI